MNTFTLTKQEQSLFEKVKDYKERVDFQIKEGTAKENICLDKYLMD